MSTIQLSFTIQPITASDISACAQISGLEPETDRHTLFKSSGSVNAFNSASDMQKVLEHYNSRPKGAVDMAMAVDNSTRQVLGWAVWGFRGFNSPEGEARRAKELQQLNEGAAAGPEVSTTTQFVNPESQGNASKSTRERLEAYTDADMEAWMKRLMPLGARCMYVCSIVVHPEYRGAGVGSALMRRGTDRADAERVYCWVHASEDGVRMFEKHGFKEAGRLELDLDAWNSEHVTPPEGPGGKWGTYVFRYMKRDAMVEAA